MLRKKLIILFLLIVQAVIIGHGVVAHHHHENRNGHGHDHDSDDHEARCLTDLFSSIRHSGEQITYTNETQDILIVKEITQPFNAVMVTFQYPEAYTAIYQRQKKYPFQRPVFYQPPHDGAHSLRGPPSLIVA